MSKQRQIARTICELFYESPNRTLGYCLNRSTGVPHVIANLIRESENTTHRALNVVVANPYQTHFPKWRRILGPRVRIIRPEKLEQDIDAFYASPTDILILIDWLQWNTGDKFCNRGLNTLLDTSDKRLIININ